MALPVRARVVVSLTNPEATLVEEERVITLQKGVNQVDFSWQAVNIDPTSIQVRMLKNPAKVLVLNTSYPPNETALISGNQQPGGPGGTRPRGPKMYQRQAGEKYGKRCYRAHK